MFASLVPPPRLGAWALSVALVAAAACSSGTSPDEKPTRADISVTGTAPAQLQLVISTDFFEMVDDVTFEILQVLNTADTLFIDPPFEQTVPLTDLGSIVVELTNHEEESAQVRMRVTLDSGQDPFDQSATMSLGGTLRYVFTFIQRVI